MTNNTPTPHSAADIKARQKRNLLIGIVLILLAGFWVMSTLNDNNSASSKRKDKTEETNFDTPLKNIDNQGAFINRTQNQITAQQKNTEAIQAQLDLLRQNKTTEAGVVQQQAQTIKQLQSEIEDIRKQVSLHPASGQSDGNFLPNGGQSNDGIISDDHLQLTPRKTLYDLIPAKNPETFVPAGTFVSAIALGGADASAGITSQSDPTPMLFRLVGQGTLPNHAHSQLKNCVATAAAIGDISAERGQIRIERLSCTKDNGQIVEMPVEATIFGPDGKNGVRGNPLWREGPLLQRAFMAGTLSGISGGIANSYTTSQITPFGQVQSVNNGKILQYGLATGVGNAAEKLADYNIKMADQYHPVIQLSAGTVVDIVFLKGFYLDGKKHNADNEDTQSNDNAIFAQAHQSHPDNQSNLNNPNNTDNQNNSSAPFQTVSQAQPLPLTQPQIDALKQKNAKQGYF